MSRRKSTWSLDPNEVTTTHHAGITRSRRRVGQSRALDSREVTVVLRHDPTGLEVSGLVPRGGYSRKELKQRCTELAETLYPRLESLVAKRLQIPGR